MPNGECPVGAEVREKARNNAKYINAVSDSVGELRDDIFDIAQRLKAVEVRLLMISGLGGTVGGIIAGVVTAIVVNYLTGG
ncbi:MAG: hypothetical protein GY771_14060 [bacterium]|nr:hypothetical protein [bacterium]